MKLDESYLDRYWRFALPVACAGCAASLAWAAALAVFDLPDAPVAIDIGLFFGVFPLHLGTILTARRVGWDRGRDRSVRWWIGQSLLGGLVFAAAIQWRDLWAGPHNDSTPLVVVAGFYGVAVAMGRRYRRSVRARTGTTATPAPPVGPPIVPAPPSSGPPAYLIAPLTSPAAVDTGADGPWPMPVAIPRPPRPPDTDGVAGCLVRFVPALVGAVVIYVFILRGSGTGPIVGPEDRPFYVATVVGGERIRTIGIHEEPSDPPPALRAAACRNYRDFLGDRSLGTELAIVDDPSLLRSAELLDGAWEGDAVALDAETFLVQAGNVTGARARMADEDWSAAAVRRADRYFASRAQPPTAGAEDRYVVYTTSQTRSRRLLVRLAVDPEAERFEKPRYNRADEIEVVLPDGSVAVIDESHCWE